MNMWPKSQKILPHTVCSRISSTYHFLILKTKFTFIDLFAGMGGFRLAMQAQGGKCVFSSEWNKYAQKTYLANFGEMPFGDITKEITKSYIPRNLMCYVPAFRVNHFYCRSIEEKSLGRETGFKDKHKVRIILMWQTLSVVTVPSILLENVKTWCLMTKATRSR